jgi:ABC-2 type transport system permease protein
VNKTSSINFYIKSGKRVGIYFRAFAGLLARDTRVLRRDFLSFLLRTVMNPILFTFIFAYVFPKIGEGFGAGGASESFGTILLPGLIGVAMIFQGIAAVALPLVNEFGRTKEIEDRLMAPIPVAGVALEKIVFGALQSLVAALVVFPLVAVIPATPVSINVTSWPMLIIVLFFASLISGAFGLVVGTLFRPEQVPLIFSIIVTPLTFLGCVYYPWQSLASLPVLQYAVLVNPVVYISEGLRDALTPNIPHMSPVVFLGAMVLLLAVLIAAAFRLFLRRVTA